MVKKVNVVVVGATGLVGGSMLSILAERKFPAAQVFAVASERSAGKRVEFGNKQLVVEDLAEFDFSK
ncbi:MAG TPA: aspartate-semialdehyde dehydrogenase, partial [Gammaproteobacteria bacterium]